MDELACEHCGAHLPVPFWRWNRRLADNGGASGTVRCGVCGWRYELNHESREWRVVGEQPPAHAPGRPRLDLG